MVCSSVNNLVFADYNGTEKPVLLLEVVIKLGVSCRVQDVILVLESKQRKGSHLGKYHRAPQKHPTILNLPGCWSLGTKEGKTHNSSQHDLLNSWHKFKATFLKAGNWWYIFSKQEQRRMLFSQMSDYTSVFSKSWVTPSVSNPFSQLCRWCSGLFQNILLPRSQGQLEFWSFLSIFFRLIFEWF